MKEKYSKLLLGEDMSGGGKGVSSALALSNAITNLAGMHKINAGSHKNTTKCQNLLYNTLCSDSTASVFGEQRKLEPMEADRKLRWKKEADWLLSVTDYIVEFVPSQQKSKDGTTMEVEYISNIH